MCTSSTATPAASGGSLVGARRGEEAEQRPQPLAAGGERLAGDLGGEARAALDRLGEPRLELGHVGREARASRRRRRACSSASRRAGSRVQRDDRARRAGGTAPRRTRPRAAAPPAPRPAGSGAPTRAGTCRRRRPGSSLPEQRHDPVEPEREERPQRAARARDLEDREPAAGPQHAAQLAQPELEVGDVADAEADRRRVERRRPRTAARACRPRPTRPPAPCGAPARASAARSRGRSPRPRRRAGRRARGRRCRRRRRARGRPGARRPRRRAGASAGRGRRSSRGSSRRRPARSGRTSSARRRAPGSRLPQRRASVVEPSWSSTRATTKSTTGRSQGLDEPLRVWRSRDAGDAEEDAHSCQQPMRSGLPRAYLGPSTPRGTSRARQVLARRAANDGIGRPGVAHDGHFRCAIWNAMPLPFAPFGGQVGRTEVAAAGADVGVAVEAADSAKSFAPATAAWLPAKPCSFAHFGTFASSSEPSDSFAVAPFQVRSPIEMITSIAATIATGRRERTPLGPPVDERAARAGAAARSSGCRSCRGSPTPAT